MTFFSCSEQIFTFWIKNYLNVFGFDGVSQNKKRSVFEIFETQRTIVILPFGFFSVSICVL